MYQRYEVYSPCMVQRKTRKSSVSIGLIKTRQVIITRRQMPVEIFVVLMGKEEMLFNPMLSLSAFPYDFFQSAQFQHFNTPRIYAKSVQDNPPFFVKQCWDGDLSSPSCLWWERTWEYACGFTHVNVCTKSVRKSTVHLQSFCLTYS